MLEGKNNALSAPELLRSLERAYGATSLWAVYSILNKLFKFHDRASLSKYILLKDWLEQQEARRLKIGEVGFTMEQSNTFLINALEKEIERYLIRKKHPFLLKFMGFCYCIWS